VELWQFLVEGGVPMIYNQALSLLPFVAKHGQEIGEPIELLGLTLFVRCCCLEMTTWRLKTAPRFASGDPLLYSNYYVSSEFSK